MSEPYDPNPPAEIPPYFPPSPPGYPIAAQPVAFGYQGQPWYPMQAGYPSPYPVPGFRDPDRRPGSVAAGAVLAFVESGLLVAAGVLLLLGASFVNAMSTDLTSNDHDTIVWLAVAGVANLVLAALAVVGGILICNRQGAGRWWLSAAALADLVCAIVWLVHAPTTFFFALLLAGPMVVGAILVWPRSVTAWLSRTNGVRAG